MPTNAPTRPDVEQRAITVECRTEKRDDGKPGTIVGYAAVFDQPARIWDFDEVIGRGAFDAVLRGTPDTRALLNHDPSMVLGRTTNGTVRMSIDTTGLRVEIDLPDTQVGRDTYTLVERGDVSQMSFQFTIAKQSWEDRGDHPPLRTIEEVGELLDVAVVTYPAYEGTSVSARSREAFEALRASRESARARARAVLALACTENHPNTSDCG